jgi:hypothetical protein
MYTEEEAKKKWCPMVRLPELEIAEPEIVEASNRCEGAGCMMWRWDDTRGRWLGYCGLAGKPQ